MMKQYLYNFGIYKNIYRVNNRIFIFPELCDYFYDNEFIHKISQKVVVDNGYELECSTDLILKNKELIYELKDDDCYLFFYSVNDIYLNKNPPSHFDEWDLNLKINELCFLGWTINNANGMDSAATDGVFPFMVKEYVVDNEIKHSCVIYCADELNQWGLIPNLDICQKYLEYNKNEITLFVMDEQIEADWQPVGIYCDKYTFKKLQKIL